MANKQRYTAQQMIDALRRNRGRIYLAAEELGCHIDTFRKYGQRYASVQYEIDKYKGLRLDKAENKLEDAVNRGDPWAVKYMLSTLGKERGYSEKLDVQHSGEIAVKGYTTVSPDDWHDDSTD